MTHRDDRPAAAADRLFYALWPSAALRDDVARRLPARLPGSARPQRPDQWHVTLQFLGSVERERLPALIDLGDAVAADAAAFTVSFDHLEFWRRPQVLCLAASVVPPGLDALVRRLREGLAARGFEPESRPFRPHVTLARKVRAATAAPLAEPVSWPADEWALVRSVTDPAGSRHEPLVRWNLRRAGARESGFSGPI